MGHLARIFTGKQSPRIPYTEIKESVMIDQAAWSGAGQDGVCADGVDVQTSLNELEIYHDSR